jgi:hypothetical protein
MKIKVLLAVLVVFLCVGNLLADNIKVGDQVKISWDGNANGGGPFTLTNLTTSDNFTTFCLERNEYFTPGTTYTVQNISTGAAAGGMAGGVSGVDPLDVRTAYVYYNYRVHNWSALGNFDGSAEDLHTLQAAIWFFEEELTPNTNLTGIDSVLYNQLIAVNPGWTDLGPVRVLDYSTGSARTQDMLAMVPEPATMLLLGIGLIGLAGIRRRFL